MGVGEFVEVFHSSRPALLLRVFASLHGSLLCLTLTFSAYCRCIKASVAMPCLWLCLGSYFLCSAGKTPRGAQDGRPAKTVQRDALLEGEVVNGWELSAPHCRYRRASIAGPARTRGRCLLMNEYPLALQKVPSPLPCAPRCHIMRIPWPCHEIKCSSLSASLGRVCSPREEQHAGPPHHQCRHKHTYPIPASQVAPPTRT